ncbi:hypothetical protein HFN80_16990 [Rhizobium laguerreae]|uniref:LysR substrate-binding domain-containing protein n=1 Tax=Rhizobium laguerreae TaxID=1076926 RepID=UPI001C911D66|nr:LysR substrate-binding domain-containing protein [Rhizobium laguerreae]MBY3465689.1 hypothetical protein [Rhizobium laguerreae]
MELAIRTGILADHAGLTSRVVARQPMIVWRPRLSGCTSYTGKLEKARLSPGRCLPSFRTGATPDISGCGRSVEILPRNTIRLDDLEAVAQAAASGAGLAWLPAWLVRDRLAEGVFVQVLADRLPFLYDCHSVWLQTPHLLRKVSMAVDALAEALPRDIV